MLPHVLLYFLKSLRCFQNISSLSLSVSLISHTISHTHSLSLARIGRLWGNKHFLNPQWFSFLVLGSKDHNLVLHLMKFISEIEPYFVLDLFVIIIVFLFYLVRFYGFCLRNVWYLNEFTLSSIMENNSIRISSFLPFLVLRMGTFNLYLSSYSITI